MGMKTIVLLTAVICAIHLSAGPASQPGDTSTPASQPAQRVAAGQSGGISRMLDEAMLNTILDERTVERCGLAKLTEAEREELDKVILQAMRGSAAYQRAYLYLLANGWREVRIVEKTTIRQGDWDRIGRPGVVISGLGHRFYVGNVTNLDLGPTMARELAGLEVLDSNGFAVRLTPAYP